MSDDLSFEPDPVARDWWRAALERCRGERAALAELFPALPRRIGRGPAPSRRVERSFAGDLPARADLAAWRACDLAALHLVAAAGAGGDALLDLYRHGDLDERASVLRAASLLPVDDGTVALLEEAHRSNMESHFAAAACDSNLAARAASHPSFGREGFNRMVLKAAFVGLPLARLIDAPLRANAELSRMLLDLASEREAAGRAIWPDTLELAAHAPAPGVAARIAGALEHGDDRLRAAAARGLLVMNRPDLAPFARERLDREPRSEIQELLRRAIAAAK